MGSGNDISVHISVSGAAVAPATHELDVPDVVPDSIFDPANAVSDGDGEIQADGPQDGDPVPLEQDVEDRHTAGHHVSDAEYEQLTSSLNSDQKSAFDSMTDVLRQRQLFRMGCADECPDPLHVFITGGAGTAVAF